MKLTNDTTKGGRPKLDDVDRRSKLLGMRCNAAEFAIIEQNAASVGLTVGEFMRVAALKCKIEIKQGDLSREFMVEVSRIGNNLNQLTLYAHVDRFGPYFEERLAHTLDEVGKILRKGHGLGS